MNKLNRLTLLTLRTSKKSTNIIKQCETTEVLNDWHYSPALFTKCFSSYAVGNIKRPAFKSSSSLSRHNISLCNVLYGNGVDESQLKKDIENLTDQFMEARELMEDARESQGTVYFSDDVEDAQKAVKETLEGYQNLLGRLSDSQKQQVIRTIGLKMEELRAQLVAMEEELKEDH